MNDLTASSKMLRFFCEIDHNSQKEESKQVYINFHLMYDNSNRKNFIIGKGE